ncbi:MAG: Eco57I restriction-modification methylase domain-containing protein [Pyrinomonadaceae bacterium]
MNGDFALTPHIPTDRAITRKVRKETGAHYTPQILADFVAEKIIQSGVASKKGEKIRILDPSVGDGELLFSVAQKLKSTGAKLEINGFDTDTAAVNTAKRRLENSFSTLNVAIRREDFTLFSLNYKNEGSLFPLPKYDVVIANPPYVRTQVLGAIQSQELARSFGLTGRVDLYHVFIAGIAAVLL